MWASRVLAGAVIVLAGEHSAAGQTALGGAASTPQTNVEPVAPQTPNPGAPAESQIANPYGADLFGNMGGLRTYLDRAGLAIAVTDNSEVIGNSSGGFRRQVDVEGIGFGAVTLDGAKALGWDGFQANASAYYIYGRGLSANAIGNLNTVSNLEADRSAKLFELWAEQSFWNGKVSLRLGQQASDQEFVVNPNAGLFVNAHFGFPDLLSNDLPSGGPAYPLGTPAIRLKWQASKAITFLTAVFSGDPAPPGLNPDGQQRDASGTAFNLRSGAFFIAEAQWAPGGDAAAATYKVGGWYNTQNFADQRLDDLGRPLASPASTGQPLQHRGDWSLYALADAVLWRPPGAKAGGIAGFARIMGAPSDRNLVSYSADAGLTWKGLVEARPDDTVGLGFEWAKVSSDAAKADEARDVFTGILGPVRRSEEVFELTYQAAVTASIQIQPVFEYVVRPGGGVPLPSAPRERAGDAAVFGLRGIFTF